MSVVPAITQMNLEIEAFIKAMRAEKEELRLFQFLNGLDDDYKAQRSQLLMQSPLPTVEAACKQLQQEESQRDVLNVSKVPLESSAMYGKKGEELVCTACGGKGHKTEKCWTVVVYPR